MSGHKHKVRNVSVSEKKMCEHLKLMKMEIQIHKEQPSNEIRNKVKYRKKSLRSLQEEEHLDSQKAVLCLFGS
jgi:hypothetical protein